MADVKPVSLDPDTFVGTGFLEDKDATIHSFSFGMYDYNGTADEDLPCLIAEMTVEGSEKTKKEYWKMGAPDKVAPTADGKGIGLLTKKGLSNASKGYLFLKSLKDNGVPSAMINGGDITVLNGIKVHFSMLQVTSKDNDGKEFSYQVPVVTEVLAMPGEVAKETAEKKEEAAKEEAAADDDLTKEALNYLVEIVTKAGGSLVKTGLAPLAFAAVPDDDPTRKSEILGIMFDDPTTSAVIDHKDGVMTLKK
jgi:hypothetical protein